MLVTRKLLPFIQDGGFVSFTSSMAGYLPVFGYAGYTAAKSGIIGFAGVLRQELAARRISVHVLCPPDTDTPGHRREVLIRPAETSAISRTASLLLPEEVAHCFLNKLGGNS